MYVCIYIYTHTHKDRDKFPMKLKYLHLYFNMITKLCFCKISISEIIDLQLDQDAFLCVK